MMKPILSLLVCLAVLPAVAQKNDKDPAALPPEIDFKSPPFWMASYDEYKMLRKTQKSYYLEKVGPEIRKVPGLEKIAQEEIVEAAEWSKDWEKIMRKVYQVCLNKTLDKQCRGVAAVRLDAINLHANEKLENRNAGKEISGEVKNEKASSDTKKDSSKK